MRVRFLVQLCRGTVAGPANRYFTWSVHADHSFGPGQDAVATWPFPFPFSFPFVLFSALAFFSIGRSAAARVGWGVSRIFESPRLMAASTRCHNAGSSSSATTTSFAFRQTVRVAFTDAILSSLMVQVTEHSLTLTSCPYVYQFVKVTLVLIWPDSHALKGLDRRRSCRLDSRAAETETPPEGGVSELHSATEIYKVDSISKPHASSSDSGMYFELRFRRAHSRKRVERTY